MYMRIVHIYEFLAWIKSKNPFYAGIAIDFEALNRCPDNDIYDNVSIYAMTRILMMKGMWHLQIIIIGI